MSETNDQSSGVVRLIRRCRTMLGRFLGPTHVASPSAVSPVNLSQRNSSPAALSQDVDYAMQIIRGFEMWAKNAGFELKEKRVLELGPGINLAGALGLKALGAAEALAADRWLSPWQDDYNPAFCRLMAERVRAEESAWNASVFERAAESGYSGLVTLVASPAENLAKAGIGSVDGVFSNAVLEHMSDHPATVKALAAVTRSGGIGFHQVDFRYHGDFSRPLDHLLVSADEHAEQARATSYEMGCQLRPSELLAMFEAAGFAAEFHPGEEVEPGYFGQFLQALRQSQSPYRDAQENVLKATGAFYVVRKL